MALGFLAPGCRRPAPPDPNAVSQRIEQRILQGKVAVAADEAEKAAAQDWEPGQEWRWRFRILQAKAELEQRRNQDVLALLEQDLPAPLAKGDLAIQREMYRALAYSRLGQPDRAQSSIEEAQRLSVSSGSSLEGEMANTRGVLAIDRGRLDEAAALFHKALEPARRSADKLLEASLELNLGLVALHRERFDEALYWSNAASKLAQSIGARGHLVKTLGNTGWAQYKLGDFDLALASFQQAGREAHDLGMTSTEAKWLNNAGAAFFALGNFNEAEGDYRQSLALAESLHNPQDIADAHSNLASLDYRLGKFDDARQHARRALELSRSTGYKDAEQEAMFVEAMLEAQAGHRGEARQQLAAIEASEGSPSRRWVVEDALASLCEQDHDESRADRWYRKAVSTFEKQRSSLQNDESKLPFFTNAGQLYRDYADFLVAHHRSAEALQLLDLGRARTLEDGLRLGSSRTLARRAVDPEALAAGLRGTILMYALGPRQSYLWTISPSATRLFKLPPEAEIAALVKNYQHAILNSHDVLERADEAGRRLYDVLVAPAGLKLPANANVFVIPDGALNGLNFETLLVPGPRLHYWIDDVAITAADSLRLLATFKAHVPRPAPSQLLLIGDPEPATAEFADLPNAGAEVSGIEEHFAPESRLVLTHRQAQPSAYSASHPERFRYIHFVAHGTASQTSPLDSAVILSNSPANPDAFKLYARDIVQQPLNADLVTVSACYGSGLRNYAGEGLVGLSWAFLRAGAHHVIAALWAVSDSSTPELMDRLYSGLAGGSPPDAALRAAKLSLVHSKGAYRKPLYWAPFQLYAGS